MILCDWSWVCRASLWKLDGVAGGRFESAQTGGVRTTEQRNVTIRARRVLQAFDRRIQTGGAVRLRDPGRDRWSWRPLRGWARFGGLVSRDDTQVSQVNGGLWRATRRRWSGTGLRWLAVSIAGS